MSHVNCQNSILCNCKLSRAYQIIHRNVSSMKICLGTFTETEKISLANPVSKGSIRKPIRKWEDNIKVDLSNIHVVRI
jgi:hypothetical protein